MTSCQRVSRFPVPGVLLGAGLDDHGPRKQNSGFVPREQQYGARPRLRRSFTNKIAALSLSVADPLI